MQIAFKDSLGGWRLACRKSDVHKQLTIVIFSLSSPFLHRRQQALQQQIRSHHDGFMSIESVLSTFRRLNALPIFRNGQQQQLPHFCPLVSGCVDDFPAIIWALSDRPLPQHDDNPQQIFRFRDISAMLELKRDEKKMLSD